MQQCLFCFEFEGGPRSKICTRAPKNLATPLEPLKLLKSKQSSYLHELLHHFTAWCMLCFWQLCCLAIESASSCTVPDKNHNSSEESVGLGTHQGSDVYVWGSNSSHQLAEGMQEKVPSPKQSTAFVDVMEVNLCIELYSSFNVHLLL